MEEASAVLPGREVQRAGIAHGRGLDDVGVEERVRGRVEAERHGQRPDNGQSDRWRTLEDAEREPDVSPERLKAHARLRRAERVPMFQLRIGPSRVEPTKVALRRLNGHVPGAARILTLHRYRRISALRASSRWVHDPHENFPSRGVGVYRVGHCVRRKVAGFNRAGLEDDRGACHITGRAAARAFRRQARVRVHSPGCWLRRTPTRVAGPSEDTDLDPRGARAQRRGDRHPPIPTGYTGAGIWPRGCDPRGSCRASRASSCSTWSGTRIST